MATENLHNDRQCMDIISIPMTCDRKHANYMHEIIEIDVCVKQNCIIYRHNITSIPGENLFSSRFNLEIHMISTRVARKKHHAFTCKDKDYATTQKHATYDKLSLCVVFCRQNEKTFFHEIPFSGHAKTTKPISEEDRDTQLFVR